MSLKLGSKGQFWCNIADYTKYYIKIGYFKLNYLKDLSINFQSVNCILLVLLRVILTNIFRCFGAALQKIQNDFFFFHFWAHETENAWITLCILNPSQGGLIFNNNKNQVNWCSGFWDMGPSMLHKYFRTWLYSDTNIK